MHRKIQTELISCVCSVSYANNEVVSEQRRKNRVQSEADSLGETNVLQSEKCSTTWNLEVELSWLFQSTFSLV